MKLQLAMLMAVLGCLALVCLAAESETSETAVESNIRKSFSMPKLFDFEAFKEKFSRHYPNAIEHMRRAKVFMARAWTVFISAVKYMYRRSTKFLKLNPHSDWTKEEREAILNREGKPLPKHSKVGDTSEFPAAEPAQIEQLLAEIEARKAEDPDFAAIAAELEKGQKRAKRSADAKQPLRQIPMEQLLGGNEPEAQYNSSQESESEAEQPKPISTDEATRIDEPNGNFLFSVLRTFKSAASNIFANNEPSESVYKVVFKDDRDGQGQPAGANSELPDELFIDYRTSGCLVQPKGQKTCGSCYAFATTTLFEYLHCQQTGELVPFSEQYVVDCDRYDTLNNGCDGGHEDEVGRFFGKYGLERAVDYPYRAKREECAYGSFTQPKYMGYTKVKNGYVVALRDRASAQPANILKLLQTKGPLALGIRLPDDFHDFGGGVDLLECDPNEKGGHSMVIVGFGREDGLEYWLIRNSFGVKYGLEGHYKLAIDMPYECFMRISYANGKFVKNKLWKGQTVFDELRKRNLLSHYAQTFIKEPIEQKTFSNFNALDISS